MEIEVVGLPGLDHCHLAPQLPIMVAGHHHDDRLRNRAREPRELVERMDDRRVHRANGVENIPREHDDVGLEGYDPVDRAPKRVRDVRFALIDARLRQTVVLTETEMQI